MPPAVSVIMLAYNRPQFMRQAIESVLNQTFRDFEFLILDNGSKGDEVYNIAKEYADKDPRVHVSRVTDNLGICLGSNKLLYQVQADYVAQIEDDDFWALNKLEAQVAFLRENPDVGLYSCSRDFVNEEGKPHAEGELILRDAINPPTRAINDTLLIHGNYLASGQIYRRDVLLAVGGWRRAFVVGGNTDLFLRLQEKCSYASTSEKLLFYRVANKKREGGYANTGHANTGWRTRAYNNMAYISAIYRRQGKIDPVDDNPNMEEFVADNMLALMHLNRGANRTRGDVKWMLRHRHYRALRKFMRVYRQSNAPEKMKMYLNLLVWSVWHKRLEWLWAR